MTEEIKEILFQLEIVARKHTIKVTDTGNIETMPASVVHELRLNNYSAKILLNYITNLQKEKEDYKQRNEKAIEYIENHTENIDRGTYYEDYVETYDLLNILQGGDE